MPNYLTTPASHEALLKRFLTTIQQGSGYHFDPTYPFPLELDSGERFLTGAVATYILDSRTGEVDAQITLLEALRTPLGPERGWRRIAYPLDQWLEAHPEAPPRLLAYAALGHLKYGPSYARLRAEKYFDHITALGPIWSRSSGPKERAPSPPN